MLNFGCKCLIFSELSGSKIELFDFWIISGILSGCLGVVTNIAHPKPPPDAHRPQRGTGVTAENEPKRAGATLKNFFSSNSQGRAARMGSFQAEKGRKR